MDVSPTGDSPAPAQIHPSVSGRPFRFQICCLFCVFLTFGVAPDTYSQSADTSDLSVQSVGLTVEALDRAVPFYRDVLRFTPIDTVETARPSVGRLLGVFGTRVRVVTMRLGKEHIELVEFQSQPGRPIPPDARSNDLWFQHVAIVVSDIEAAFRRLLRHDAALISPRPQTLPASIPAAAGISALYFRDPTGNPLEIIHYPPDKGQPRWQRETDSLFLGIDHTALAVVDTERSLAFYQNELGFTVAGESVNVGSEQERLTGVFGARVRITGLRPPGGGIGVELLEYKAPSTGRPLPPDTRAGDLWHAHIRMQMSPLNPLIQRLLEGGSPFVSPGVVPLPGAPFGYDAAAMMRDPSGHALLLTSPTTP